MFVGTVSVFVMQLVFVSAATGRSQGAVFASLVICKASFPPHLPPSADAPSHPPVFQHLGPALVPQRCLEVLLLLLPKVSPQESLSFFKVIHLVVHRPLLVTQVVQKGQCHSPCPPLLDPQEMPLATQVAHQGRDSTPTKGEVWTGSVQGVTPTSPHPWHSPKNPLARTAVFSTAKCETVIQAFNQRRP